MEPRPRQLHLVVGLVGFVWAIVAPAVIAGAQTPKRGGTLRVSYGNEISNLDFHTATSRSTWRAHN